jgi:hypothetical protein
MEDLQDCYTGTGRYSLNRQIAQFVVTKQESVVCIDLILASSVVLY